MNTPEEEAVIERHLAIVRKHVDELRLHFDTVQIMCTKLKTNEDAVDLKDEGTYQFSLGAGNWYARFGHLCMFVEREKRGDDD